MGSACAGGKYIEYRGFLSNHLSQVFDFTFIVPTLRGMFFLCVDTSAPILVSKRAHLFAFCTHFQKKYEPSHLALN